MANKKAKGKRGKTRRKLKSKGGKKTVNAFVREFDEGSQVQICIDSSVHNGMPAVKYHGFNGQVIGKRGNSFEIAVRDGSIPKKLVVGAAHLKKLKVHKA